MGLLLAQASWAGTVLGKVQAGGKALEDAVVWLEGVKGMKPPKQYPKLGVKLSQYPVLDQKGKRFIPRVLPVMVGSVVTFLNSDPFLHNTYSAKAPKGVRFNFNQESKGSRSLFKVTKPGPIEVRCHIHPNMLAYIVVVPSPAFAVSNRRGLFKIEGVPAGTYTVKCWAPGRGLLTQKITVKQQGETPVLLKYAK
jgi:plastocyanin